MISEFDLNSGEKSFSDKIQKIPVNVVIKAGDSIIIGDIHIRPQNRIMDELSFGDQYLAVTDAVIYDASGKARFKTKFMSLNSSTIVYVIPKEELVSKQNSASK